ncbi:PREDICTED: fucose-1-phosphate guanylyltransferase-like [Priapulus caudatus]|uniref:Fucose-1-phosphate guanylyltransferase-like n=1 Tax=Priapulus caudatus TaxID=37621 RepID=A0ABM1EZA5_PRICU|nr:PREDICTED: fucose-1-phosphate guanylyltransferase-like [Priapulus caudatus]
MSAPMMECNSTMLQLLSDYDKLRGQTEMPCREDSSRFWDLVVITTADEDQKLAYEKQIKAKRKRKELPPIAIHVFADPPGPKIGNGGSTFHALLLLRDIEGSSVENKHILLIHAGGQSKRLPSATVVGKIFTALPFGSPMYQMLDMKLAMYAPFIRRMKPGVFLTCADDIEVYELGRDDDWTFSNPGFTALAHPSPLSTGTGHGVFILPQGGATSHDAATRPGGATFTSECLAVLQKPTEAMMRERGAVRHHEGAPPYVYTDSAFYFDAGVAARLLRFREREGAAVAACEIDAYGDFLAALGARATPAHVRDARNVTTDSGAALVVTRERLFCALAGVPLHVVALNRSTFYHLGTMREYLGHLCDGGDLAGRLGFGRFVFSLQLRCGDDASVPAMSGDKMEGRRRVAASDRGTGGYQGGVGDEQGGAGDEQGGAGVGQAVAGARHSRVSVKPRAAVQGCIMHSILADGSTVHRRSVVEYCRFERPVVVGDRCIVSNCSFVTSEAAVAPSTLRVPTGAFLHTVPVQRGGQLFYATVTLRTDDDVKRSVAVATDGGALSYLGAPLSDFLRPAADSDGAATWGQIFEAGATEFSLWTAKLFPLSSTMAASFVSALSLLRSVEAGERVCRSDGADDVYVSLADVTRMKDLEDLLRYRTELHESIFAGHSPVSH